MRSAIVAGTALGNPMNVVLVIAVYASISKELGLPLRFPGRPGAYDKLMEMTDAGLLVEGTVWAANSKQCANQAFNITNGDLFRWNDLCPKIAKYFNMKCAPPLQLSLQTVMADKGHLWIRMQEKHGLAKHGYQEVSSWAFRDAVFAWDHDFFGNGTKARRLGFHEFVDTEQMFFELFDQLKASKVIPL